MIRKLLTTRALIVTMLLGLLPTFSIAAWADDVTEWTSTNSLPQQGNYKLMNDVTLPTGNSVVVTIGSGKSLTIDLNGKTINAPKDRVNIQNTLFKLEGGSLTIKDSQGGGVITRPDWTDDGIVWNTKGGNFYMEGGTITGIETKASIVTCFDESTFTMTGGSIVGNTLADRTDNYAVSITSGTFRISGNSTITNNNGAVDSSKRNVYLSNDMPIAVIGELLNSTPIGVTMQTPGVFTNSENVTLNDASKFLSDDENYFVKKNADGQLTLIDQPVASVTIGDATTEYSTLTEALEAWVDGSTLTLLEDATTSSRIIVPAGDYTLDLNGYGITQTGQDCVLYVGSSSALTIKDSNADRSTHYYSAATSSAPGTVSDISDESHPYSFTGGYITGGIGKISNGSNDWRKGGAIYTDGTLTMDGGTLVGNYVKPAGMNGVEGGSVYVAGTGTFTLNDGGAILAGNTSNGAGGVFVESNATFNMNGGSIKHCYGPFGAAVRTSGKFNMPGGTISENTSTNTSIAAGSNISIIGGSVINNKCSGVRAPVVTVGGNAVIKGNTVSETDNTPKNVYLGDTYKIIVSDNLGENAYIGVTMQTPGVFTSSENTDFNDAAKFFSDDENYIVRKTAEGQLKLGVPSVASVTAEGTTTEYETLAEALEAWVDGSTLKLLKDVETASTITVPSGDHTLNLNGHNLTKTGSGRVFDVASNSTLNLYDYVGNGVISGGYVTSGNGGGVAVVGTFNMYGGILSGNTVTRTAAGQGHGCAVFIGGGGNFNMSGGSITENTGLHGAISLVNDANCTITGGSITNNATNGAIHTNGLNGELHLTITGGVIAADGDKYGVLLSGKTDDSFTLSGNPSISSISISNSSEDLRLEIGGTLTYDTPIPVYLSSGLGWVTRGWENNMGDAEPSDYFVSGNVSYDIVKDGEELKLYVPPVATVTIGDATTEYTTLTDALAAWVDGSTLTLLKDVETASTISAPNGNHVLDLNSHVLKGTGSEMSVISIFEGADLTINGPGKITGGTGDRTGGGYKRGGAISVGSIAVPELGGTVTINNCEISENAADFGAGIYTYGGNTTLNNVLITKNSTLVYMDGGTLTVIDSKITGNNGATFLCRNALIRVKGKTIIYDNETNGKQNNLYLHHNSSEDSYIEVIGELDADAKIGINKADAPIVLSQGSTDYNDVSKFVSDNENYIVRKTAEGQLKLGVPPVATVTADGTTTEYETLAEALEAWVDGSTLTLLKDVKTTSTIVVPSGSLTFDLNGHGILMTGGKTVLQVGNANDPTTNLTMIDSDPERVHYVTLEEYHAISVSDDGTESVTNGTGTVKIAGGYIAGGEIGLPCVGGTNFKAGGGIYVGRATFTMKAGTIIGNTAVGNSGGGLHVSGVDSHAIMDGGRICYNSANGGGGVNIGIMGYNSTAAGVGKFTMNAGQMEYNFAIASANGHGGGGIRINNGEMHFNGGSIVNNRTQGTSTGGILYDLTGAGEGNKNYLYISGNAVLKDNYNEVGISNLYLTNGACITVEGAMGESAQIGVSMQTPGVFTNSENADLNDASKFVSDNEDYSVRKTAEGQLELYALTVARVTVDGVPTEYTSLAEALEAWVDGSTLTLLKDVETASSIEVTSGTRTLDLNGYGIKMTGSGSVIIVDQEADLTMNDSRPDYTNDSSRRPLDLTDEKVKGGYITGGTGHTVSTNQIKGGGVYTVGSFTMNGGTIIDCHITTDINNNHGGGGVYVGNLGSGVFNMNGGAILKCSVETPNGSAWGGGVCVDATFNMNGGRIEGNSTTGINATGAGVWGRDNNSLSGASVIMNNMANGAQSNYMVSGNDANIPTISGLTEGANIGIDTYTSPNNTTDVRFGKLCDKNSIQYLHSDRSSTAGIVYCDGTTDWIYHNGKIQEFTDAHHSHEAESYYLTVEARTYTVSYDSNGATSGAAPTDNLSYFYGETVTILGSADIAKTGYSFAGWNTEADGTGVSYEAGDMFEVVGNLTLYAQWEIDKYTLTVSANNDELGSVEVNTAGIIDNQDGTYTVEYGTEVTIKATAVEGYHLDSWSNGAEVNEAGTIAVVVVSDTSIVANFAVDKIAITPTVAIEGWKYGDTPKQPTVTGNDGDGEVTYVYARKGSDDFSEEVPTEAGDYVVKVLIGQTDEYAAGEATAEFTIGKADNKAATIVLEGWKYGETPKKPTVTGNGDNGTVTYLYAAKGSDEFSETAPTTAGDYVVKAIIDETANFEATTVTAEFTIEKAIVTVSGVEVATTKLFDNTTEAEVIKQGTLTNLQGSDVLEYTVTAAYNDATPGSGKTITLTYTLIGPKSLMGNYSLASTTVVYSTDGYIAEPIVVDTEHQASGANTVMRNGFEISLFGYCSGGDYSLQYHLGSGDPDQYKVEFENSRFTDIDWTNLTTAGADGTIEIDIPANLPTGDYGMKVTFRNSHYVAFESDPIEVSFHVNLPETYTRPLFDNVIAVVDTCNCLTDIQWYHRDNSNADWEAISGATGYYYRQVGGLTGEYFISTKMNGVSNYTCPQTDMKTLYGAPASVTTVHVSPNPVVNNAQITIEGSESFEHELRIVNIMGNEVEVRTFNGSNTTIDMGAYPMGNYMICVDGMVVKVIKK